MKRRILILGPTAPSIGGITTAVNTLMGSELAKEFNIRLLANSNHRPMNKKGVVDFYNLTSALLILFRLVRVIYLFRPQIVQVETAGEIGFLKQSVYILTARLLRSKVIVSLHCANDDEPLMEFTRQGKIARWYCGWILRRCQMIKLLSPKWSRNFASRWGLEYDQVVGLKNCLDSFFPWGLALSLSPRSEALTIVSVGSVGERKGSFLLIEAVKRMNASGLSVSLVLVGPEERTGGMAALEEAARIGGIHDKVHLLGGQSRERVLEVLSKADVFALPSYAEGMPYSIIEALAIGCPVVASDVGAVRDIITNEQTGLLIEAGSIDQLYEALYRLALDDILRNKLALQGNTFAHREFGIHNLENTLRAVYEVLFKVNGTDDSLSGSDVVS
jgi:glycosyltransferase involved in cell wall biosynthesis